MSEEDIEKLTEEIETILAEQKIKRLKKKTKKKNPQTAFKYLIVMDFEATCFEKPFNSRSKQEIIEWPAVLLNLETGQLEKEFHKYLKPENLQLSEYCINLTGITQDVVNQGDSFQEVMASFTKWMKEIIKENKLVLPKTKKSDPNCAFVTWGNWDFLIQLRNECQRKKVKKPPFFNQWIDLKQIYIENTSMKENTFTFSDALTRSGLEFVGRPHSGLDDARNTAFLAYKMYKEGCYLHLTKDLNPQPFNRSF